MPSGNSEFWAISRNPPGGIVRLRWLAASERMTEDDFRLALLRLTQALEATDSLAIRIDVRDLRYRPTGGDVAWRSKVITPRWNRANLRKLAYIVASATPGSDIPAHRPGEAFLTRFVASTDVADAWLAEE